MFAIERYPTTGRPWPLQFTDQLGRWLVDRERNLYFVILFRRMRGNDMTCLIGDGRVAIPLATEYVYWESHSDPETGESDHITRLWPFGNHSIPTADRKGCGWFLPHTFTDDADKAHWLRIAAEPILVERLGGSGVYNEEPRHRVEINGEHVRLSDFGYTPIPPPMIGPAPRAGMGTGRP